MFEKIELINILVQLYFQKLLNLSRIISRNSLDNPRLYQSCLANKDSCIFICLKTPHIGRKWRNSPSFSLSLLPNVCIHSYMCLSVARLLETSLGLSYRLGSIIFVAFGVTMRANYRRAGYSNLENSSA